MEALSRLADYIEAYFTAARSDQGLSRRKVPQDPDDEPVAELLARLKANAEAPSAKSRRPRGSTPKQN